MADKRFSGAKLKEIRRHRGLSRTALAARVGCGYDTLSTWERGQFEPKLGSFVALVEALDCDADDLMNENDPAGEPGRSKNASGRTQCVEA